MLLCNINSIFNILAVFCFKKIKKGLCSVNLKMWAFFVNTGNIIILDLFPVSRNLECINLEFGELS